MLAGLETDTKGMDDKRPTLTNYLKNLENKTPVFTKSPIKKLTRPVIPRKSPGIARKAAQLLEIGIRTANRVNNIRLSVTNNLKPSMPNIISAGTTMIND